MKINTKKCSPIRAASGGLDDDFILRHPNKYIVDDGYDEKRRDGSDNDDDSDDNDDNDDYGRKVQHLPKVVYTPVKVSLRKSFGSGNITSPYMKKRAVTDSEMDELNSCLESMYVDKSDDNGDDETKEEDCDDKVEVEERKTSKSSSKNGNECYNLDEEGNLMGRIPKYHFDSKTGKASTVLRSARSAKKKVILDL